MRAMAYNLRSQNRSEAGNTPPEEQSSGEDSSTTSPRQPGPSTATSSDFLTKQLPQGIPLPFDYAEAMEDDALLQDAPPGTLQVPASDNDKKELLKKLRQQFKKTSSNLSRSQSHLDFLQTCSAKSIVPVGLRLNKQCHALQHERTAVQQEFKMISSQAEKDFLESLLKHYGTLSAQLRKEAETISKNIAMVFNQTEKQEVKDDHNILMNKTLENVATLQKQLAEKKEQKILRLSTPPPNRGRDNRGRRGGYRGGRRGQYPTEPPRAQTPYFRQSDIVAAFSQFLSDFQPPEDFSGPPRRGGDSWRDSGNSRYRYRRQQNPRQGGGGSGGGPSRDPQPGARGP